ncbi:DUF4388 domain-containing protein [Meiothermus sp. QL-1]|uniref:DUF4388 domain-containing protein n=1 Tax=Meiothermus sp. QL-1 TaxID=2058095 RepID=UPI000E0B1F39|nr:DUF4388 domain-containing protein [Meiothermus sp. QL-1]RDI96139.1 DUF4388 domain-containing protein [Meiothermus sp. QL-1]
MEGSFHTIPLSDVLEMIHANRGTGVLQLTCGRLPLRLHFVEGEVVGGGILDWEGFEAIVTFPLHPEEGRFYFRAGPQQGTPLMPFRVFMAEWARLSDQWTRFRSVLDSPSRVLETPRATEPFAVFVGGRSVRAAARNWGVPLIIAAERAWRGLREGDLTKLRKYAWFGLRIRHPSARRTQAGIRDPEDITALLDGSCNLGELIQAGLPIPRVRAYLIDQISRGALEAPGRGWVLRDLLWEQEAEARGL